MNLGKLEFASSQRRWYGTGKSGALQSMASVRLRHDLATEQQQQFYTSCRIFFFLFCWNFERDCREYVDSCGQYGCINNINSSSQYIWNMFPLCLLNISFMSVLNVFIHKSFNTQLKLISKYFFFGCNCKWDYLYFCNLLWCMDR